MMRNHDNRSIPFIPDMENYFPTAALINIKSQVEKLETKKYGGFQNSFGTNRTKRSVF